MMAVPMLMVMPVVVVVMRLPLRFNEACFHFLLIFALGNDLRLVFLLIVLFGGAGGVLVDFLLVVFLVAVEAEHLGEEDCDQESNHQQQIGQGEDFILVLLFT